MCVVFQLIENKNKIVIFCDDWFVKKGKVCSKKLNSI